MNYILRNVQNGGSVDLAAAGVDGEVTKVWTILNEDRLYTQFDEQTGVSRKVLLQDVRPVHHWSAFAEDRLHDWNVRDGKLFYHAHSTGPGDAVDVLVVTAEDKKAQS